MVRMAPPASGPDAEAQALRNQRADLARFTLAFLLTSPSAMPLEYTYGGEAEAEDGKADVVDAKGPGSFAARLFFDKRTHRPLMLSYRGAAPRMVMQTQRGDGAAAGGGRPPPGRRCRRRRSSTSSCSSTTTRRWTASCCRTISRDRSTASRAEEMTFKTIKINPAFKPDAFTAK